MRILAPYVTLNTRVVNALNIETEFVFTGNTRFDYWNAIADRWNGTEDLLIVEQDNEIHDGVIESLKNCTQPWCCYWYKGPPVYAAEGMKQIYGLGCTRFSASLQRRFSYTRFFSDVGKQNWDAIADKMTKLFRAYGEEPHVHEQVRHHHQYQVTFMPSPSNKWRPYVWQHVAKGAYPSVNSSAIIPVDEDSFIIDGSILEIEAE